MKIGDLILHIIAIILGALLGIVGYLKFYLPLKESLDLGTLGSLAGSGEGEIVPMARLVPIYQMGGNVIDIIVLIAFAFAGAYLAVGILRAMRGTGS